MKMYGLASDEAAALVIARRGMRLSERLPSTITAYVEVNSAKHVWSMWNQLNKQIERSGKVNRRHDYFTVSNWSFLANLENEEDLSRLKERFHLHRGVRCGQII
jgi:hypothetical protein